MAFQLWFIILYHCISKSYYRDERYLDGHFPIAEKLSKAVLFYRCNTELTEGQLKYITDKVKEFIKIKNEDCSSWTGYVGLVTGTCLAETEMMSFVLI